MAASRTHEFAPPQLLHLPTWSRVLIAAKQRAVVNRGGDFYEVIQHRDGRVSVVMADVSGNGPTAAAPVSQLRWVLRQHLTRDESPGAVLATLNEHMIHDRTQQERFVTAVCVRIDPLSGRVEVASAGHLGPFVKKAGGGAEEIPLTAGLALGILAGEAYQETVIDLQPEDTLVLVTDGITDGLASSGDPLGQTGLLHRLERARQGTEAICAALLASVGRGAPDATVVVLQLPRRHRRATPVARAG